MVGAAAARPAVTPAIAPRRVTVLGATGSIGTSTLAVVADRPEAFSIEAVTANRDATRLARLARAAGARLAVIAEEGAYAELKAELAGSGIATAAGEAAVVEAAGRPADLVVAAIVGAAGLKPTYAAIAAGRTVALANKECMVSAGEVFVRAARAAGVPILPVDSEHNAIFQILAGRPREEVEKVVLTGSGGPFRAWSAERIAAATPAEALAHPTWTMGRKISIDSATLMNKGLELVEAHHLFDLPSAELDVLIHPQSIVHGLVTFRDGAVLAALGPADMRGPIAYCLSWPARPADPRGRLDLAALGALTFEAPDHARFPALALARAALDQGGSATNILSAANEVAVEAFLAGRISFPGIVQTVADTLARIAPGGAIASIDEAIALDRQGRRVAWEVIGASGRG
jgi:1-deoxy-D-xylulose-5-phosphate reductoisomerase